MLIAFFFCVCCVFYALHYLRQDVIIQRAKIQCNGTYEPDEGELMDEDENVLSELWMLSEYDSFCKRE